MFLVQWCLPGLRASILRWEFWQCWQPARMGPAGPYSRHGWIQRDRTAGTDGSSGTVQPARMGRAGPYSRHGWVQQDRTAGTDGSSGTVQPARMGRAGPYSCSRLRCERLTRHWPPGWDARTGPCPAPAPPCRCPPQQTCRLLDTESRFANETSLWRPHPHPPPRPTTTGTE